MTARPTALVTGASRGIGRATVTTLAARGWHVVAGVRDVAAADLDLPGVDVIALDVTDPGSVRAGVARAEEIAGGALHAVIGNAGHAVVGPVEDLDWDVVREMFEVNTFGAMAVVQAALPAMRAAGRGRVVFVTTVGVHLLTPFFGAYKASKVALRALAEVLAVEVRRFGIRVSSIEPGMVDTEFAKSTRRSPTLADPTSPYAPFASRFPAGLAGWRDWVNIPAQDVADAIVAVVFADDPPASVLVGDDSEHLVTLDEAGILSFLGLDRA